MIKIQNKQDCCGCSSCANACPKSCITMELDAEGFFYPHVNETTCISCGLCEKACPIISKKTPKNLAKQDAIVGQNKNNSERGDSSSGGLFSIIAKQILSNGGIVFGASYDNNWDIVHTAVESVEQLKILRGSKYVQSRIENVYKDVRDNLKLGKQVCFSGTPCQNAGLRSFLGREYDNLLTVEVVCHGVPSISLWRKYIAYLSKTFGMISEISFRDKRYGFAGSTMAITFLSGKTIALNQIAQFYKGCFFRNLSTRPSCYGCKFKEKNRNADFTIFDCWHVNEFDKSLDDDLGTSGAFINTQKAVDFLKKIQSEMRFHFVDSHKLESLDGEMLLHSIKSNPLREEFFKNMSSMTIPQMAQVYTPITIKKRFVYLLKPLMFKLRILNKMKRLLKV